MRKVLLWAAILSFGFSLAYSQSLVELAKKEKERRAKVKKKGIVVTNKDLKKKKFEPAVRTQPTLDDESTKPSPDVKPPTSPQPKTSVDQQDNQAKDETDPIKDLEEKWQKAFNAVGYLNLKLSGLWQEYYNANSATPRSVLQQQIAATFMELQLAQKEADKLKQELENARKNQRK